LSFVFFYSLYLFLIQQIWYVFFYRAKNQTGETVEGTIDAMSQNAALKLLTSQKMIILSLKDAGKLPFWRRRININFLNRTSLRDLVFLSRQISVMVAAGLPLVESLKCF